MLNILDLIEEAEMSGDAGIWNVSDSIVLTCSSVVVDGCCSASTSDIRGVRLGKKNYIPNYLISDFRLLKNP